MKHFFEGFPPTRAPDGDPLGDGRVALDLLPGGRRPTTSTSTSSALLAKAQTIAAFAYKKSIGQPFVYPQNDLSYCANFLHMMFAVPAEPYEVDAGRRARAEPAPHPARRPRAELLDLDRAHGRLQPGATSSPRSPPASAPSGARCTAAPTRRSSRCSSRSSADGGDVKKFVDDGEGQELRLPPDGLRPPRLQELRPARARSSRRPCDEVLDAARHQRPAARHRQEARGGRAQGRVLRRAQALPERRLLQRHHLPRDRHPDQHVHRDVRPRPPARAGSPTGRRCARIPTTRINRPRQIYTGHTERNWVPIKQRVQDEVLVGAK